MTFEDKLRDEFATVRRETAMGGRPVDSIKAQARRRTRRARVATGVGASVVVLGVAVGGLALLGQQDSGEPLDTVGPAATTIPAPTATTAATAVAEITESTVGTATTATALDTESRPSTGPGAANGALSGADLSYVGAFMVPAAGTGEPTFSYGGRAAAYDPDGDLGSDDGFDGSLYITGIAENTFVGEVSVPRPEAHDGSPEGLPTAQILQPLADVTGGRGTTFVGGTAQGGNDDFRIGGLEIVAGPDGRRLHWTAWQHTNTADNDVAGHGHSSLDLSNPSPQGPWYLADYLNTNTAGYLFAVPDDFATSVGLASPALVAGFQAAEDSGSQSDGPPFFGYSPPASAEPGTRLNAVELASFPPPSRAIAGFDARNVAPGADWVTASNGRRAIVTAGNAEELRSVSCEEVEQRDPASFGPRLQFFEPDDLARVAAGDIEPWAVAPYATVDVSEHLIDTCGMQLTSLSFDATTGRLYLVQVLAHTGGGFDRLPVVHVFQVS
ncbi:MAG: hypothetical protein AAF467_25920 [Actinomycetota bacterium]